MGRASRVDGEEAGGAYPWAAVTLATTAVAVAGTPVAVPGHCDGARSCSPHRPRRKRGCQEHARGTMALYSPLPLVEGVLGVVALHVDHDVRATGTS